MRSEIQIYNYNIVLLVNRMETLHIQKKSFNGYCVGMGVEYPGIIVEAKSDKELQQKFLKALPGHKKALQKRNTDKKEISVITIESIIPSK